MGGGILVPVVCLLLGLGGGEDVMRFRLRSLITTSVALCLLVLPRSYACDLEREADKMFFRIQSRANHLQEEDFSDQKMDIESLASIDSAHSNELLVSLSRVYLGPAIDQVLAAAITKKKKTLLPLLRKIEDEAPICSDPGKPCASQASKLVQLIEAGQTVDSAMGPTMHYRRAQICKRIAAAAQKASIKSEDVASVELSNGDKIDNARIISKRTSPGARAILGITLERSTFADVERLIGKTAIHREGDAGNSLAVMCFKGADETLVAFESGEMGGGVIDSIHVSATGSYRLARYCSPSEKIRKNISFADGVRLGLRKQELLKIRGQPSAVRPGLLFYLYEAPINGWTEQSMLEVKLENGRISEINTSQISAN